MDHESGCVTPSMPGGNELLLGVSKHPPFAWYSTMNLHGILV